MTTVGTMVGVVKNIMQRVSKTRQQCQDVAVSAVVMCGSKDPSSNEGGQRKKDVNAKANKVQLSKHLRDRYSPHLSGTFSGFTKRKVGTT